MNDKTDSGTQKQDCTQNHVLNIFIAKIEDELMTIDRNTCNLTYLLLKSKQDEYKSYLL